MTSEIQCNKKNDGRKLYILNKKHIMSKKANHIYFVFYMKLHPWISWLPTGCYPASILERTFSASDKTLSETENADCNER